MARYKVKYFFEGLLVQCHLTIVHIDSFQASLAFFIVFEYVRPEKFCFSLFKFCRRISGISETFYIFFEFRKRQLFKRFFSILLALLSFSKPQFINFFGSYFQKFRTLNYGNLRVVPLILFLVILNITAFSFLEASLINGGRKNNIFGQGANKYTFLRFNRYLIKSIFCTIFQRNWLSIIVIGY